MKENVIFWSKYRVVTPYFDHLVKWNPVMKVWRKLELMSDEIWRKMFGFRVSIGLLPLDFDCLMKWNPFIKVWKKLELMSMRPWRKMLGFRVLIGFLPFILIISWTSTPIMKVWNLHNWISCSWDNQGIRGRVKPIGLLQKLTLFLHCLININSDFIQNFKELGFHVHETYQNKCYFLE